ncbi:translocation/assembly module TamB domain-containing protein [Acidihalobacter prosperus]
MKRWLTRLLYGGLVFFILLSALVYLAIGTPSGSHWLLSGLTYLTHGRLSVEKSSGSLLDGLRLQGVHYRSAQYNVAISQTTIQWHPLDLLTDQITLDPLSANHIVIVRKTGSTHSTGASHSLTGLPFRIHIPKLRISDLIIKNGDRTFRLAEINAGFRVNRNRIKISQLKLSDPRGHLIIAGEILLNRPYKVDLKTHWQWVRGGTRVKIRGQGSLQGPLTRLKVVQHLVMPFKATLSGETNVSQQTGHFSLRWEQARWPLSGPAKAHSAQGLLRVDGGFTHYHIQLDASLKALDFDIPQLSVDIRGNQQDLTIHKLSAELLNGTVQGQGKVSLQGSQHWALTVSGENLNPKSVKPNWPGKLFFKTHLHGNRQQLHFMIDRLNGHLRGLPVSGKGQGEISVRQRRLSLKKLQLSALGARLSVDGQAGPKIANLQFSADIPNLKNVSPSAAGSLRAKGNIRGNWQAPLVTAALNGQQIHLNALSIEKLSASVKPTGGNTFSARIILQNIRRAKMHIQRLSLTANGLPSHMQARLDANMPEGSLAARLSGGMVSHPMRWEGQLRQLELNPRKGAPWQLRSPSRLSLGRHEIAVSNLCLQSQNARTAHACLNFKSGVSGTLFDANWIKLPIAIINPWLPQRIKLAGSLNGQAHFKGPLKTLQGQLTTNLPDGKLEITRPGQNKDYKLILSRLDLKLDRNKIDLSLKAGLPDRGTLDASLQTGRSGKAALNGQLNFKLPKLAFINGLTTRAQQIEGTLSGQLSFSGTRDAPVIKNQITLDKGAFVLPQLGIRVHDIRVDMNGSNTKSQPIQLKLHGRSGPGDIQADGQLLGLFTKTPRIQLNIHGQDFQAVNLPSLSAQITPQLTMDATPKLIRVRGQVTVPKADIKIKQLPPGTVKVSSDTHIVGENRKTASGPNINARIELILGKEVKIDTFGLSGQLTGNLLVDQVSGSPTSGNGTLKIINGTYAAYGLNLTLTQGILNFAGPVDNPGLNVIAQRQTGNVTAQLAVTGTLKSPRSNVTATPPMSESEALSWLITGHGLAGASKSDAAQLIKAIAALHMGNTGGGLLDTLKQRTGLSDIGVQGSSLQQSSLLLGKYLTPDLYIRYAAGLFDHSNTVSLNYRLSRSFSIEAKSGSAQGIDLLYQIVFGPR